LTPDRDETVCADCGLVVSEDHIDHGPEWRTFEGESDGRKKRTGSPLTRSRHDRGLTTEIGHDTDLRLTGRKRRRVARMRKLHERARIGSKTERNQVYAFTEIRRIVSSLDLSRNVRDRACVLFESAQSEDLIRGRSLEGFAAAVVYATCRTAAVSRTLDEVLDVARASRSELKTAYDVMNRELGLPTGPIDPREYLPRFASRLGLPADIERRAADLVEYGHEENLVSGRDPSGFAAASLYVAAMDTPYRMTQKEAAEVADVSAVTLRSAYQDLQH
jgi:transcription initiation factor TFIIB